MYATKRWNLEGIKIVYVSWTTGITNAQNLPANCNLLRLAVVVK